VFRHIWKRDWITSSTNTIGILTLSQSGNDEFILILNYFINLNSASNINLLINKGIISKR
jgi:hypothetical protein